MAARGIACQYDLSMVVYMRWFIIIPFCLAGCDPEMKPLGAANVQAEIGDGDGVAESQADTVEDEALVEAATAHGPLGRTVASLGDAAEPGMWLKTPLVSVRGPGRVSYPATGTSAEVTLIPISGPATAGSRMSLQAMQTLGLSLTDLAEIEVSAGA